MDSYAQLEGAVGKLDRDQLRDCVERLTIVLYGTESPEGDFVLTTDRDWPDDLLDEVMQVLAEFGLHPDDLVEPATTS